MSKQMDDIKVEDQPVDDVDQDESEKHKPKSRIHHGEIIEGKREKKTIQRLDVQIYRPKESAKIESQGKGDKLGEIARINHAIGKLDASLLKPLHKILYDRPGTATSVRKNLRLFNGFPFEPDSDSYNKKKEKVIRLPKKELKSVCETLSLERSGKIIVLVDRIMNFLLCPTDSGKPVLKKKKKSTKDAKREKKSSSRSKKPQVESGKSKAIVTDSSSDDDDEDEDEESKMKDKDTEKSLTSQNDSEGKSSDDEEEEDDAEKEESDDSNEEETKKKPAAKRKAPAKPVPKTKKADSSSNRTKKTASKNEIESSDDDDDKEPLIKMVKKPPTNDQLKETINVLLKDANLEEVTMKQLYQQVYDKYPDFDLTSRKAFIKDTVKSLIS